MGAEVTTTPRVLKVYPRSSELTLLRGEIVTHALSDLRFGVRSASATSATSR
jgi:hypothetical protein